jgi:hypothetical protein
MKTGTILITVYAVILIAGIIGEVRCIYKALSCNWDPMGKAEIIYTASACTGLGAVVGWFDIEDK